MKTVKDFVWNKEQDRAWGYIYSQVFDKTSKVRFLMALRQFIYFDIADRTKGK